MNAPKKYVPILALALSSAAYATDYYVATTGSDENDGLSSGAPFATIDKAVITAADSGDVIHVAAGTYSTTTQWGPNLAARLIGEGETRDDVVIQSSGTYRTLRMDAGSWLENVTIVGEGTWQADKGGAIQMSGGTITNCVVRDGTAKNGSSNTEGGNLYVSGSSLVVDCVISSGHATKRGGNVYLDAGTVRDCVIRDGTCDNVGGNIFQYAGTLANCTISGGTSVNDGGNVRMNGGGVMQDCVISSGTNTATSGDKKGANVYIDSTAKMSRCRLTGGVHESYNGGSLCVYSSTAVVEDCLVEDSNCGGVLLGSASYLYNCSIVNNREYGCWSWNKTQHLFNVVVFGNESEWNGELPTNASAEILGCASSAGSRLVTDGNFGVGTVSASDFADYANGDYTPATYGLIDSGVADPRGAAASTTDLAGNPRLSGPVDIGCLEYQKHELVVRIDSATPSPVYAPSVVSFAHTAENSDTQVTFTYDFGDGSSEESTTESTITHTYQNPGVYTITITASNAQHESAQMIYEGHVQIASTTVYVRPGNGDGTFPYDTPEKGYGNLKTAVQAALDGYTLLLCEGVHTTVDQVSFSKALTIRGLGASPADVVVSNTVATADTYYHRVFELNNPTGRIENITIENGCVKNQNGGNLRLVSGVVSNCVIRGGLAVVNGSGDVNAAGAGVELAGSGTLTHCVVSNNTVNGTSYNQGLAGGAIFLANGAKNGRVSNCLVAHNTYVTSGEVAKSGAAGVRFGGSNDNAAIENCTIVSNIVVGSLKEDSAGLYCTTWHGKLRNNIIVGNFETGKDAFTSVKLGFDSGSNYTYHNNLTDDAAIQESGNKSTGNVLASAADIFRNFANGDFTLKPGCAAYNKGTTTGLALLPSVDLAGNARIAFDKIDIGCYECQRKAGFALFVR